MVVRAFLQASVLVTNEGLQMTLLLGPGYSYSILPVTLVLSSWQASKILHSEYFISKTCSLTYIKKLPGDLEVRDHFIRLLSLIEFGNLLHENNEEPLSLN